MTVLILADLKYSCLVYMQLSILTEVARAPMEVLTPAQPHNGPRPACRDIRANAGFA